MSKLRRAFLLQFLSLALGVGVAVWLTRTYPVLPYVVDLREKVAHLGLWGLFAYPLLYAFCNILLLPGGAVAVGSGLFFGLWKGFALNMVGNTLGAAVAFLLSRWVGRRWVRDRFLRRPKWAALDRAIGREGAKIIFLSQVIPFAPCSLLNYLFGITQIPWRTALLWTALGQAPTMFLYAYAGTLAQVGLRIVSHGHRPTPLEYATWGGGLLVTLAAMTALARIAARLLREAKEKAALPGETAPEPAASGLSVEIERKSTLAEQVF